MPVLSMVTPKNRGMQMTAQPRLEPGPDHPITVEPEKHRVTVRFDGRVIASSTSSVRLTEASYPSVQYIPRADVDPDVLTDSDHSTYCPYKGTARYHGLRSADGAVATDKVWFYPEPYDAVSPIADHLAFYPDAVDISVEG